MEPLKCIWRYKASRMGAGSEQCPPWLTPKPRCNSVPKRLKRSFSTITSI